MGINGGPRTSLKDCGAKSLDRPQRLQRSVTSSEQASSKLVLADLKRARSAASGLDLLAAALGRQSLPGTEPRRLHTQFWIPAAAVNYVPKSYRRIECDMDGNGIARPRIPCFGSRGGGSGDCWACNGSVSVQRYADGLPHKELCSLRARAAHMEWIDAVRKTANALPPRLPLPLRRCIAEQALRSPAG